MNPCCASYVRFYRLQNALGIAQMRWDRGDKAFAEAFGDEWSREWSFLCRNHPNIDGGCDHPAYRTFRAFANLI